MTASATNIPIKKLLILVAFLLPLLQVVRGQVDTSRRRPQDSLPQRRGQQQQEQEDRQQQLDQQKKTREMLNHDEHVRELVQVYDGTNFKPPALKNSGIPTWYEKTATKGSQYLSHRWLVGVIETIDRRVSAGQSSFVYAYDKINEKLVASRDGIEIINLSMDTIRSFALADSNTVYLFERLPFIKSGLFFQPILKTEKGFSLYKRVLTKLEPADFQATGYRATGRRYDEYVDYCEYYLVFPDHQTYKKIYLHLPSVRKALKTKEAEVKEFFSRNGDLLTEESLTDLIHTLNNKLSCCSTTLVKLTICKIPKQEYSSQRSRS